ncbi:uncharacterized protein CBL_00405 [Carabus blaptoides fortunei]
MKRVVITGIGILSPLGCGVCESWTNLIEGRCGITKLQAKEALDDAKWYPDDENDKERTGVAVGMGMVDLQDICATNDALKKSYNRISPYFVPRILPNMAAGHISIKYEFRGPNHSVSTACATGAHAIGDAFRFIQRGDADVMITSIKCIIQ